MDEVGGEEDDCGKEAVGMRKDEIPERHDRDDGESRPMPGKTILGIPDDKRNGRRGDGEAYEVRQKLPLQKEHPGKAGEGHGGHSAGGEDRCAVREKHAHEGVGTSGEDDAAQGCIQGVEHQGRIESRERTGEGGCCMPGGWIVSGAARFGEGSRPCIECRPALRVDEMPRQGIMRLVVKAAVIGKRPIEAFDEHVAANGKPDDEVGAQKEPREFAAASLLATCH